MKDEQNNLKKLLGIGFGIAVTVGGTIGTGILRKPGPIAEMIQSPTVIIILWFAVGLYALLGVLCAIELAVMLPQAGAWYVYSRRAFGDFVGFITGVTSWFGTVAALGFGAYTMSEYLAILMPSLNNSLALVAIGFLIIMTGFHLLGTKSAGKSQEVLAIIKALGLIIFVIVCFFYGGNPSGSELNTTMQNTSTPITIAAIIGSLQAIFYTYDGWHTATYFTEENTDPAKTIPKSMLLGLVAIIVIYLLVNLAIFYALPFETLKGTKLAASETINHMFGPQYAKIVTIFLLISILGIVNAQIMFAPRVIFSMGRDGLFYRGTTLVNKWGTPWIAMCSTTVLSTLLILSGKDTCDRLSNIATFFFVLSYALGFAALIMLRYKEPNLARPFRAPFFPGLPVLLIVLSLGFLIGAIAGDMESSKFALIFLVISYPMYLMVKRFNNLKLSES
jgi:basic amino acid/polyamine antiporter, APA family